MILTPDGLESLRSRLIVSCQAYPGEPMRDPRTTAQLAASAVIGGAAAVRVQGLADIQHTRAAVEVPVIGLWKDGHDGVLITPTLRHALAVANAGAHIVAIDGTRRQRPDGLSLAATVAGIRGGSHALVMADCGSYDDAAAAVDAGVDLIGTTLAGYTSERTKTQGPDLELLERIAAAAFGKPLIAEGRIHTPEQARQALGAGAFAVVVGTAITHPATITGWFTAALHC
ncbi:N-acetylmannosamine-6-phosphate 2-epimerase [Arthrobacter sp. AL08]|uniref:N-acetylmannosamine-6-phosphate 2-epimerase n=1 Tax=Micrococcaceae TaxID=1268 RepID=UPI001CFF86E9|nr:MULTISPECIES: N-acetylmannosamine-6-phosphate 2-epimerase [Micrococcaceae]MCB5283467.1 putative N-acetylmannosamine-6-phosphate 2-epimerase [Arthrobacter sp. ES1]MDD1477810.1 N-acetylmannosamine-6-phosphate 2-epimerase [Arthrobacter sp. H16F315]MDI3243114.1 N-acetylmannosamine-6-phosphate 2-epimerase [Arthrobacter sp. AL05]MDI3279146.1 N-acetylmannosamine-6-phosphate 2-epimerase [Arthrobacter sp. AL08]MDJ0353991.1 N-acetylmannosamine-6-phosphate 2-epimerase [Pseudarthrobacter sp. PH31-O2]